MGQFQAVHWFRSLDFTSSIQMTDALLPHPRRAYAELGLFHVISAFCDTLVAQTAEIKRTSPNSAYSCWHTLILLIIVDKRLFLGAGAVAYTFLL